MKKSILVIFLTILLYGFGASQSINVTFPSTEDLVCIGQTIQITWTKSGAMNANVKIRLMKGHGGIEDLVLAITDSTPNSGSYTWPVPGSLATGSYLIRVKTVDNDVGNDGDFFTISDCLYPDLYISGRIQVKPTHPRLNEETLITAEIRNSKPVYSDPCRARLVIKGPLGFHTITKYFSVHKLHPQSDSLKLYKLEYRHRFNKMGAYRVTVTVDDNRKIKEDKENNNEKFRIFPVHPLPDLSVYIGSVGGSYVGKKKTVKAEVKNLGPGKSPRVKLKFYLEAEGTKEITVDPLSPDEKRTYKRSHRYWRRGTKKYWIQVDPNNAVKELNENNNKVSGTFKVQLTGFDESGVDYPARCLKISFSKPKNVNLFEKVAIVLTAKNIESNKSLPLKIKFAIQDHKTVVWAVPELFPGQEFERPYQVKWNTPGRKSFSARIFTSKQCKTVSGYVYVKQLSIVRD